MIKKISGIALASAMAISFCAGAAADDLTILSANDTHSSIQINSKNGLGGVIRRKALVDSVKSCNKNVVAIHAGDAVQGTLYFSLFGGEVEYAALDSVGYDMVIAGNHEFDNGADSLAYYYKNVKAAKLSANYDVSHTRLAGLTKPYIIKDFDGKRVAFIGINLQPSGMIVDKNVEGLVYHNSIEVANATAHRLKTDEKVDYVVVVSHIGFDGKEDGENDVSLAKNSTDIDVIVGGHSHSSVCDGGKHSNRILNKNGRPVTIVQAGKNGEHMGKVVLDLDNGKVKECVLIPVDAALDNRAGRFTAMKQWLEPYTEKVDSIMNRTVGYAATALNNRKDNELPNWTCDAVMDIAKNLYGDDIDCCILNKGGVRSSMPEGAISEGLLGSIYPFDNRLVVMKIKGSDLLDALQVMASRGGDAVGKELDVVFVPGDKNKPARIKSAKLNGKKIKKNKTYTLVTIDYLANGGDYMEPLTHGEKVMVDEVKYGDHILNYVNALTAAGKQIGTTKEHRMRKVGQKRF